MFDQNRFRCSAGNAEEAKTALNKMLSARPVEQLTLEMRRCRVFAEARQSGDLAVSL
jgi:hypothetical protein